MECIMVHMEVGYDQRTAGTGGIFFKSGKQVLMELTSSYKAIFKAFNLKAPAPSSL